MIRCLCVALVVVATVPCLWSQSPSTARSPRLDSAQVQQLFAADSSARIWYKRMLTPGIRQDSGRFLFDEEARKIMADSAYRVTRVPPVVSWKMVAVSLERSDLRHAAWCLLRLYSTDSAKVVGVLDLYNTVLPPDSLVSTAFYTYALLDPRITRFEDGRPLVVRPDILEDLFADLVALSSELRRKRLQRHPQK